jgi:hypothetical protein
VRQVARYARLNDCHKNLTYGTQIIESPTIFPAFADFLLFLQVFLHSSKWIHCNSIALIGDVYCCLVVQYGLSNSYIHLIELGCYLIEIDSLLPSCIHYSYGRETNLVSQCTCCSADRLTQGGNVYLLMTTILMMTHTYYISTYGFT